MGAWIETKLLNDKDTNLSVAPRVGAWIETAEMVGDLAGRLSHPVWVRGLKPTDQDCGSP